MPTPHAAVGAARKARPDSGLSEATAPIYDDARGRVADTTPGVKAAPARGKVASLPPPIYSNKQRLLPRHRLVIVLPTVSDQNRRQR